MSPRVKPYSEDLAYIHDSGFGDLAKNAAPEIIKLLKKHRIRNGLVVELGCGSGILARELLRQKYDVFGIDQSAAMIRLAKTKAPKAKFVAKSFYQTKLPSCSAVISTGECINYLFDERSGSMAVRRLFKKVFAALNPGGIFLFDLLLPGQGKRCTLRSGKDWDIFAGSTEDFNNHILTRYIILYRRSGKVITRSEETHRQKLFSVDETTNDLIAAGFSVEVFDGYGRLKLPNHAVYLAKKP